MASPGTIADAVKEHVFGLIEAAAREGRRCPQNEEIRGALYSAGLQFGNGVTAGDVIKALAREGRVRGGVYGRNWRTLHICVGPHAGKSTKPCDHASAPHMIYDEHGCSPAAHRRSRGAA